MPHRHKYLVYHFDLFQVNIYNIGHYNSFLLYAHALNETLEAGEDPRDGRDIVKRMWNRTFEGNVNNNHMFKRKNGIQIRTSLKTFF